MNTKINVLLIDDDPISLSLLKMYLKEHEEIEVAGDFTDPIKALDFLENAEIDLVFLDIEMYKMNGIEVAERIISLNKQIYIVFVTGYCDYAVKAFDLNSLDYLMKPICKNRLSKTIERYLVQSKKEIPKIKPFHKIYIQCFGEFNISMIEAYEKKYLSWNTRKTKEVCAYLVHHLDQWVKRDELLEEIWPDKEYDKAKVNLYTCIYNIKKSFRTIGLDELIQSTLEGYRLKFPKEFMISIDIKEFAEMIHTIIEVTDLNIEQCKEIEKIFIGEYLGKDAYLWAVEKQYQFNQMYISLLEKMVSYYKDNGDHFAQEQLLKKIIKYSPDLEWAYRQLMLLYIETGNRIDAARTYNQLQVVLKTELGIVPEQKTFQLFKNI